MGKMNCQSSIYLDYTLNDLNNIERKNTNSEIAVNVQQLVFEYKNNVRTLKNISIQIPEGDIYAILGSNGCGKTTLLRLMLGRLKPKSGSIRIFGREPGSNQYEVGYMPQEIALFNEFTIEEILHYFGKLHHINIDSINDRITHLIQLLSLPEKDRRISQLSGGQERLVSIAVTMIHRPRLLILDEPTVGVDSLLRHRIWDYLDNICIKNGITVVITTHYIEEAKTASKVAFMESGILLAQAKPIELLVNHKCLTLEEVFLKLCQQRIQKKRVHRLTIKMFNSVEVSKLEDPFIAKQIESPKGQNFIDYDHMSALLRKNYIRVKRNLLILIIFHLLPIMQIISFELTFGENPSNLPIAIYSAESNPKLSKLFIDRIDTKLIHTNQYSMQESAIDSVIKGKNWFAVSFAQNFSYSFKNRLLRPNNLTDKELEFSKIKLYADMSNSIVGTHIHRYLLETYRSFLHNYSSSLGYNPLIFSLPVNVEQPIYGRRNLTYNEYISPGIMLCIHHALPLVSATFVILLERKDGHLERTLAAGVKPIEILFSHIILLFFAIISQVSLSMFVMFFLFEKPLKGSVVDVFGCLVSQGLQGMSFGLLISLIVSDEFLASASIIAIVFLLWISSGAFWPLEAIPSRLSHIFYWNPLTHSIDSLRSVMLRGWSISNTNVRIGYVVNLTYTIVILIINLLIFENFTSSTFTFNFFESV